MTGAPQLSSSEALSNLLFRRSAPLTRELRTEGTLSCALGSLALLREEIGADGRKATCLTTLSDRVGDKVREPEPFASLVGLAKTWLFVNFSLEGISPFAVADAWGDEHRWRELLFKGAKYEVMGVRLVLETFVFFAMICNEGQKQVRVGRQVNATVPSRESHGVWFSRTKMSHYKIINRLLYEEEKSVKYIFSQISSHEQAKIQKTSSLAL